MKRLAAALMAAVVLGGAPVAASADTFNVPMSGQHRGTLAGLDRFAIPTYHLNFITSQQATAAASIMSRVRLAMVLVGPDQATMRRLTNEAYADLRAQMEAAGLMLVSPEETRTMVVAAGYEDIPGNVELAGIGPGITIGSSVRSGWATFGPDVAPALTAFRMPRNQMSAALSIQAGNRLNGPLGQAGAIMLAPQLTLDFVAMNASTGGAAVRAGAGLSDIVDDNYQAVARARGDAVVADMPVWEGLIRDAYRGYNAGIVAAILGTRR